MASDLLSALDGTVGEDRDVLAACLAAALDHATDVLIVTDAEGNILHVNRAFERMSGYAADEVRGSNPRLLKSGMQDPEVYGEMWACLADGEVWRGRLVNRRKDGSLVRVDAVIAPVRGEGGAVARYVALERDLGEILDLQRRLRSSIRMEALGTLAGGIAHEFNNILYVIMGFTELAQMRAESGRPVDSQLVEVLSAIGRARELVDQILSMSRRGEEGKQPVLLLPTVKETIKMLRAALPSSVGVKQRVDTSSRAVMADPTQIYQVLTTLCANAYHGMRNIEGEIEIRLEPVTVAADETPGLEAGEYLLLAVRDSVDDTDEVEVQRLLEGAEAAEGDVAGVGISVVVEIVQDHGGRITFTRDPGEGKTFSIYLPVVEAPELDAAGAEDAMRGGNERILCVDDEAPVLELQRELLQALGYRVTIVNKSLEALERVRERPDGYDLLITNLAMPGLTGDRLAREVHGIRPDLPIVLCTGFGRQLEGEEDALIGIRRVISKPVSVLTLARAVREALDEPP